MIKVCSNKECLRTYGTSDGGQYGRRSNAVLVTLGKDGKPDKVIGFCSARCLVEFQGHKIEATLAYKCFTEAGIPYDGSFPSGLPQERRLTITPSGKHP